MSDRLLQAEVCGTNEVGGDEASEIEAVGASLDETGSSADFELHNESDEQIWQRTGSLNSSVAEHSVESSEKIEVTSKPSPAVPTSKQIEQGVILKQLVLKGITSQLETAQAKLKSKEATCLTVLSTWIGIGTKNGLVLVFDVTQNLKWYLDTIDVLGSKTAPGEGEWNNAVSALAFNADHSRLLVGNARGHILEYDMKDGKLLRTLNDVHPPEAAVLHLKFTDVPTLAVLCDSGGSVFELAFKRTLGIRGGVDTRCLFSGSRGEVCALEPLLCPTGLQSNIVHGLHSAWESSVIIAMATLSKVLIVQIRPTTRVIGTHPLEGDRLSPPCLAWHFVAVQSQRRGRSVEPVIAFGRQRQLHLIQLTANDDDMDHTGRHRIRSRPLLRFQLDFDLRALQWIDARMLALIDSHRQVNVVDIKSREAVDAVDVSQLDLVTSAPFFSALATGGNVSPAMGLVGREAFYNSMASCSGQILLLCSGSLRSIGLRHWDERLDLLVSQSRPEAAIRLGLRMLHGKAKAMQSLKGSPTHRQGMIKDKLMFILNDYMERVLEPLLISPATDGGNRSLQSVLEVCTELCIHLDSTGSSQSLEHLHSTVQSSQSALATFLQLLEPHLINSHMPCMPPLIMQQFVSYYEDWGRLESLEMCICSVDVACLDLHQILTLSQRHGLHRAYIYVHTRALGDYVNPLEDLMKQLQAAVRLGPPYSEQDLNLGHCILVYISCCLAGRHAYPSSVLIEPQDVRLKVKHQVLSSLTCLHSKRAPDDEPPYPYLRTLLEFDAQELLNALALAFQEEEEFSVGEMGARRRQRVVDILVDIMIHSQSHFSPDEICSLFTFIARQMSRSDERNVEEDGNYHPTSGVQLDRTVFQQLLQLVCTQSSTGDESRFEERQQALLQLLQVKGSNQDQQLLDDLDQNKLLVQARAAKFYRVCEYIYEQRCDWEKVFECYVDDPSRHGDLLHLVRKILSFEEQEKQMESALLKRIDLLVSVIDDPPSLLAVFLAANKSHLIAQSIEALQASPKEQYRFLGAVIELANQDHHELFGDEQELWIEVYASLMAQQEPIRLATYVQQVDARFLDRLLPICRQNNLIEAESSLLERQGEMEAAYNLLLNQLSSSIQNLFTCQEDASWTRFHSASQSVLDFCQRQSATMTEMDRERIWLTLLDHLLAPQRMTKSSAILAGLRQETQQIVSGVQGQVSLTKVLARLIEEPETTGGTLGDIRQLIMGLLDNYTYETTLLRIGTRLLQGDVHGLLLQRCKQSVRGVSLRSSSGGCSSCRHPLDQLQMNDSASRIVAFHCRHVFHSTCLSSQDYCIACHPPSVAFQPVVRPTQPKEQTAPTLSPVQIESVTVARRRLASMTSSPPVLELNIPS